MRHGRMPAWSTGRTGSADSDGKLARFCRLRAFGKIRAAIPALPELSLGDEAHRRWAQATL